MERPVPPGGRRLGVSSALQPSLGSVARPGPACTAGLSGQPAGARVACLAGVVIGAAAGVVIGVVAGSGTSPPLRALTPPDPLAWRAA